MLRRVAALFAVALFAAGVYGQSIVTYAGGGTLDGQLLSDILASGASGIALDGAGNIVVVMRLSGQVLKAKRYDPRRDHPGRERCVRIRG